MSKYAFVIVLTVNDNRKLTMDQVAERIEGHAWKRLNLEDNHRFRAEPERCYVLQTKLGGYVVIQPRKDSVEEVPAACILEDAPKPHPRRPAPTDEELKQRLEELLRSDIFNPRPRTKR